MIDLKMLLRGRDLFLYRVSHEIIFRAALCQNVSCLSVSFRYKLNCELLKKMFNSQWLFNSTVCIVFRMY